MRQSHLTALAVMVALVGAMFVAFAPASAASPAAPEAPTGPASYDDSSTSAFDLSWTAPTADPAVTDYDVRYRESGSQSWTSHGQDANDATTADDTNVTLSFTVSADGANTDELVQFSTYEFQVRPQNSDGEGPWSPTLVAQIGQDEAVGACDAAQTLELDADDATDGDTEGEACTIPAVFGTAGSAEVTLAGDTSAVNATGGASGTVLTITALGEESGTATVTVKWTAESPTRTSEEKSYVITVNAHALAPAGGTAAGTPSVVLEIDDSDDTVGNAVTGHYGITITTKNIPALALEANSFAPVYVSGELDDAHFRAGTVEDETVTYKTNVTVPQGTTPGEYTLSVSFFVNGQTYRASDVLIVGDAGDAIGAAALSLGVSAGQDTPLDSSDDTAESGFSGSTDEINLNLSIGNSLGQPANADDIKEILVVAPRATIRYADATGRALGEMEKLPNDGRIPAHDSVSSMLIEVTSSDGAPRAIDVYVIVLGTSASERSETVSLTFTGPLASLNAGDASGNVLAYTAGDDDEDKGMDARDRITFTVDATDKAGNTVGTPALSAKVTGPDGGTTVHSSKYTITQSGVLSNSVHLDVDAAATAPLKTGVYQVTFSSGAVKTDPVSFNVVGTADSIEVEVSEMAPNEVGQTITVTATVMSGEEVVADGTTVTFTSPDVTGDADAVLVATTTQTPGTKAGVTSVTYAVVGAGTAVVTATVTDDTTPATDIAVVVSTAGMTEPEAMPDEEASVSCLHNLAGFTSWTCDVESSASEIFGLVSGRGVTALHLWNGTAWVRYSVVDGTMVPGSSDFMVAKGDTLYISN